MNQIVFFFLDDPSRCNGFLAEWSCQPENKHLLANDSDEENGNDENDRHNNMNNSNSLSGDESDEQVQAVVNNERVRFNIY